MELANIEKLVEKYLNAETSLQEEQTLKHYFTNGNVLPHLEEYSYLFNYFKANKQEKFTQTIKLDTKKSKKRNFKWLSVAASFALLVSVFIGHQEYQERQQRKQYNQVVKAFKLLSANLKKGDKAFESLYTYENTVKKVNTILEPSK